MNPFTTAFVKAPKRSRFDFNHSNTFGMRVGALTPTLSRFIVPGDEVSLSMEQICRLAPMPVPTFVNLKVRHDFFFVPLRLLYGQEYLDKLFGADVELPRAGCASLLPFQNLFGSFYLTGYGYGYEANPGSGEPFVPGSLCDYLRYPVLTDRNGGLTADDLQDLAQSPEEFGRSFTDDEAVDARITAMKQSGPVSVEPLFAYHFIWRDWYRFTGIQDNDIAETYLANGILSQWSLDSTPLINPDGEDVKSSTALSTAFPSMATYIEGDSLPKFSFGDMAKFHYAHYRKDMFTSVRYGSKPTVLIPTGDNGTIPALREASAVQRFLDIISITGQRYFDKVKGLFGVESVGPKDDRVQFLARYQQFIKIGEVLTTATTSEAHTGDYSGRGVLIDGKYLFKRRFSEHGWLMCVSSIVPDIAYNGLSRELSDVYPLDTPIPSLAEVGDQTVFAKEVSFSYRSDALNNASLGDQFRFYAYKSAPSEVHGFFLMDTARPWSPLQPKVNGWTDIINDTKIYPYQWNYLFIDTSDEYLFGDRFFFNIDFYESITRALPKYINYHL